MKDRIVSKGIHSAVVAIVLAFIAVAASCMRETADTSDDPLSLCTVFADYDVCEAAIQRQFEAAFGDYAHLLDETVGESDVLDHRRERLASLAELRHHYRRTFVRELPALVQDSFEPDWATWTEWQVFAGKFRPGNELWYFVLPESQVGRGAARRGYVIAQGDRLRAMLLNRTVVFGARYADYESLLDDLATESQIVAWRKQQFASLDDLRQHHRDHFGSDSTRIVLEPQCRLGKAAGTPTKWDHWHVFGRRYQPGDQLWYFESPTWNAPNGRAGYLILREGRLYGMILVAIT